MNNFAVPRFQVKNKLTTNDNLENFKYSVSQPFLNSQRRFILFELATITYLPASTSDRYNNIKCRLTVLLISFSHQWQTRSVVQSAVTGSAYNQVFTDACLLLECSSAEIQLNKYYFDWPFKTSGKTRIKPRLACWSRNAFRTTSDAVITFSAATLINCALICSQ